MKAILFITLSFLTNFGDFNDPQYFDSDTYLECFQNATGWYHLSGTCIFPLTQFERNYSTAVQMCGAINHSIGYREINWLIASQLFDLLHSQNNKELRKLYWTGLQVRNTESLGVESEDATDDFTKTANFTSIYNPLWASGQPPETLPTSLLTTSCVALDVRNSSFFGWRVLPCSTQLPILCQNYACLRDTFRCVDNSKCIPAEFLNDGFDDCLDGSDERTPAAPLSFSADSMFLHEDEQKTFEWPLKVSSGGVLSPSTIRYGKGECTHRWTIVSPEDRHFVVFIKWLSTSTATTISIEGKDQNGRFLVNSRNATSSITLSSSSFVLTASDTDTRIQEFQVFYQDIDPSICQLSSENRLSFTSTSHPSPCFYQFTTATPTSYVALLIHKCEGISSTVAQVSYRNTTVILPPMSVKKLLVLPTSHVEVNVEQSTWPGSETQLEIQMLEIKIGGESLDVFMIDREFEIEWIKDSGDVRMDGDFRTLSVNMIMTGEQLEESTWQIKNFGKTCSEDNVQIISTNNSQFLPTGSGVLSGHGPTTVLIHQSAEPFELHAFYSIPEVRHFDESASTMAPVSTTTSSGNNGFCPLPSVRNGYISYVSNYNYARNNTYIQVTCLEGFYSLDSIYCSSHGTWELPDGTKATTPLECLPISCSNITSVERTFQLSPDNYTTAYGSTRRYSNWYTASYGPFCVCGDRIPDQWSCYNDMEVDYQNGACIKPHIDDASMWLDREFSIFPTGYTITVNCLICPSMLKNYTCHNGLWYYHGTVQPYTSFKCDCADDPEFIDPCMPHGRYQQERGEYICECDNGYKFYNGTCQDRNECEEGSDFCDKFSTCVNTDGGFTCSCSSSFHTFTSADLPQWSMISEHLIEGYSCVESTCYAKVDFSGQNIDVIEPPALQTTSYYRSPNFTDYYFATNICNDEYRCVFPFNYRCMGETLFKQRDPLSACPALDNTVFSFETPRSPNFHTFQMIDVSCADVYSTLIGRPVVFCNSALNWEVLPVCIRESCSDPSDLIQRPLWFNSSSSDGSFHLYTQLTFMCLPGYVLIGEPIISCARDWQNGTMYWDHSLPTCVPISGSTVTPTASSSATTTSYLYSSSAPGSTLPPTFSVPTLTPTSANPLIGSTGNPKASSSAMPTSYLLSSSSPSSLTPGSTMPPTSLLPTFSVPTLTPTSANPLIGSTMAPETSTLFPDGDDVIIEDSVVFEERNVLQDQAMWIMSGDWSWTTSGCALHQFTFPTSFFVTSSPVQLSSEGIELVVDVSQCQSSFQVSVFSSDTPFVPALSDFRTVLNATTSGSFVVKLRNVKKYLSVSLRATGRIQICGVMVREQQCKEVDVDGIHLEKSGTFSMRRYLPASCNRVPTTVNGYCDSRRGWVIQKTVCACNPCAVTPPSVQRDQTGNCQLNSCSNGKCIQFNNGTYDCTCNEYFKRALQEDGTPHCKPDHCRYTSPIRNSGYDCETGENDKTRMCADAEQFGSFCQYQGKLENSSYTYVLEEHSEVAVAINVCEDTKYVYAIPDVSCSVPPTPAPTSSDPCDICKDALQTCAKSNPPFVGGAYCMCKNSDEYGRSCAVRKFCFNDDGSYRCENGGVCNLDEQKCECRPEFYGDYCEHYNGTDSCYAGNRIDCVNGNCVSENGMVYCNCNEGWIKDPNGTCTIKWDMCALNNPCQQNGTCTFDLITGQQSCYCDRWNGDYCEIPPTTSDCSMCLNSEKCFDKFTTGTRCQCSPGYGGDACSISISDCDYLPCQNGGTCNSYNYEFGGVFESYNCTCPEGFSGANCETRTFKTCEETIKCENGGTCVFDNNGNATCRCSDQYFGDRCERLCSDQCIHSHGCFFNGTVYCECLKGFSSRLCDVVDNVCEANVLVCQNQGTCNATTQTCTCTGSYYGKYCEIDGDLCKTNSIQCENGGTCVSNRTSFECKCPPNFTGVYCENQFDKCRDITCNNGGTCFPSNGTCACPLGTTGDQCQYLGQPCKVLLSNGTYTDYCLNGGKCTDLPNGAACDCDKTGYTGRRCETNGTSNFNLVFNGLPYDPDIVSSSFSNASIREFTLCSFVQYNQPSSNGSVTLPPYLSMRGYSSRSQQMIFDNNGFFICFDQECTRSEAASFTKTPITANTWHHFCVVSPDSNERTPKYAVYLDGLKVNEQLAAKFQPGEYAYIYLAPSNTTVDRFVGMISMTQLYHVRLNDAQIGQIAFDCYSSLDSLANLTLKKWNGDFTRVSSYNPGVFVDPAGICKSVKCMFGRQVGSNNYNSTGTCDKDRISPTVLRCPKTIRENTELDFMRVSWNDEDISFFDNIGVVRIDVNFHNGQQFGIGITAVRYIAFDAAGNSAECTFDVIVAQKVCPNPSQLAVENGSISTSRMNAPFVNLASYVKCDDPLFPCDDRPRFYTCDIMGDFNTGSWFNNKFYLPSCGRTVAALQSVNGTVVGEGTCSEVSQKLHDTIWKTAQCDKINSCSLTILPPCDSRLSTRPQNNSSQQALTYTFSTKNATFNVEGALLSSLQSQFDVVKQNGTVDCDSQHPIKDSDGNNTICVSCPSGTFADQTLNKCTICPLDTYRGPTSSDQSECTSCPDGTTTGSVTGAMDVSLCYKKCDVGQFEQSGKCVPCPIGTFGDRVGIRKCTCCPFDLSTKDEGSQSENDCSVTCPPGEEMVRNISFTSPECIKCEKGYYKEGTGGPCLQCPRGLTTSSTGSISINSCSELNCIDLNTRRNSNITVGPSTPYSEMCIACEQGQFQNTPNSDHCFPCSELKETDEVPVTCQSTCSPEVKTVGCNCQVSAAKYANCLPEVEPVHSLNPLKIVLPVVFGVLLLIIMVTAFCFRKQIIAWFKKTVTNDNQHVAPSHWNRQSTSETPIIRRTSNVPPPTSIIPRPNLRILTNREELDNLPPMPSSSQPSFHVDSSNFRSNGFGSGVSFEANGSPIIERTPRVESDDSSLDSFF